MQTKFEGGPVQEVELPPSARALCSLPRIDYWDAFEARTDRARDLSAEEWARKVLGEAPASFRLTAPLAWLALGLKHGSPWSGDHLLGWPVRRRDPDFILLGAESRTGMPAELLLKRERDSILFSTFIQHRGPVMRRIWQPIIGPHRRIVSALVRRAVESGEVGDPGFEPGTSSLSETRSNRLS